MSRSYLIGVACVCLSMVWALSPMKDKLKAEEMMQRMKNPNELVLFDFNSDASVSEWRVINDTVNEHHYIDFNDVFGLDIWVPGGSSINIEFGDVNQVQVGYIMLDLSDLIGYSPILGEVRLRILTDLGNTAMTKYE